MEDDEIWKVIKDPVDNFTGSIKDMQTNIDKLITFYNRHTNKNVFIKREKSQILTTEKRPTSNTNESLIDSQNSQLSPISIAKIQLAIVYAMNTCYRLCLVTHGQNPDHHVEVVKEFERIKLFMKRAKEVEESLPYYIHENDNTNVLSSNDRDRINSAKRPKIDKDAAKRFCLNNMTVLKSEWT